MSRLVCSSLIFTASDPEKLNLKVLTYPDITGSGSGSGGLWVNNPEQQAETSNVKWSGGSDSEEMTGGRTEGRRTQMAEMVLHFSEER